MKKPLRVLHLEDNPADAALIKQSLEDGDIVSAITIVHTRAEFLAQLESGGHDLILSDFSVPTLDGLSALKILRSQLPRLPFIFVLGIKGESFLIELIKSGATDYVFKSRLAKLVPAVRRAIIEVEHRAEHQLMESKFIEAQKMEVIGQLAAGVAHDFNNILGVIMGYSDILRMKLPTVHPLRNYIEEIRRAADRAAGLTLQLLVFGRKQTVQPIVIDLNSVVRDMEELLKRLIEENISLTIELRNIPSFILADPGHIGQVLMNLAINARDAMPEGGRLSIEISKITLDVNYTETYPDLIPGDFIRISVNDTGTGMTEAVKARIFEAFFTTKPAGKGTGLGLATCQTIVKQSGGFMSVCSELSKGTTFQIYFPCVSQPQEFSAKPVMCDSLPSGSETLLLVEDDMALRNLAVEILRPQGYNVLTAANGLDGLNVARTHLGSPIQMVVTDVIMPQMSGKDMSELLKLSNSDLKVLFVSGYSDEVISQQGILKAGVNYLPKPYTPAKLSRKIRDMLDTQNNLLTFTE